MSCVGKSTKCNTSTKTCNGKTTTTVTVEETFKYSDGRTETKTRQMIVEGPPPSKEDVQKFIDAGDGNEDAFKKMSISNNTPNQSQLSNKTSDTPKKVTSSEPAQPPGEYAKEALKAHNEFRAKHGVPSLTLSQDLCTMAQKWADHLHATNKMGHSPGDSRKGIGENIAYMSGSSPNLDYPAKDATASSYSEIKDYGSYYGKEPPPFGSVPAYGHFTQVVWKGTKSMGIGRAKGNGRVVVVANYEPAGNFIGSYAQNVMPPK